jgi:glycosyltransferase involved in cell wall biosynthesis
MKKNENEPQIIFLNQVSGRLFQELAEELAGSVDSQCILYTGSDKSNKIKSTSNLKIIKAPEYHRGNYYSRLLDWFKYFWFVFWSVLKQPSSTLIFIVSNPPFLPLIGYLMKKLRGQPYVVLIYDIYPDLAIYLGKISRQGPLAWMWRWFNKGAWQNSEAVFTIGDDMAIKLEGMFKANRTQLGHVAVISNWVDHNFIKPLSKEKNWFAQKYGQVNKFTVLYSGNLGATHDLETILEAAKELGNFKDIQFLIVGDGYKRAYIEKFIDQEKLSTILLLPFQAESVLPYSLTTGDVAVITLSKGVEGLSVPGKVYYAMAGGSALLCISSGNNELKTIIKNHQCGISVEPGDVEGFVSVIKRFYEDPVFLKSCKENARKAVESYYTKKNIGKYREILVDKLKLFHNN